MHSSLVAQSLRWAFRAWRKHSMAWALLWLVLLVVFSVYFFTAILVGLINPLLAVLVYTIGCIIPAYAYGAFIRAGLSQYAHQDEVIEKRFFSYFSIGAALDILFVRILFVASLLAFGFIMLPIRFLLSINADSGYMYACALIAVYGIYSALYFCSYALVDAHQKRSLVNALRYAYHARWYCLSMVFAWVFGLMLTAISLGIAGFFLFPLLTLADVYAYNAVKNRIPHTAMEKRGDE